MSGKIDLTFNFEKKVSGLSECCPFLKTKLIEFIDWQKIPIEWIECHSMSGGSPVYKATI